MLPHLPPSIALLALCAGLLAGCERAPAPAPEPPRAVTALPASAAVVAAPVAVRASASAAPASAPAPAPAPAGGPPADVAAFRDQRDQCDHFRGEDPYDAKRAAELAEQLDKFCKGTDARLAGLRKKYAAQPAVLESLKDYEPQVE
jgi:hypothetical protein